MEDSLIADLRAGDRDGRIVHANPAFCAMVGCSLDEMQRAPHPPYWPPERAADYRQPQAGRLAPDALVEAPPEGRETVFMRRDGERFPVMIYEAPPVDGAGQHTSWSSAALWPRCR